MGLLDLHRRGRVILGLDVGDAFTAFSATDTVGKGLLNAFIPGAGDTVSQYTNKAADWGKQKYAPDVFAREQAQRAAKAQAAKEAELKKVEPEHAKAFAAHRGASSHASWVEPVAVGGAVAVVLGLAVSLVRRRK